MHEFLGACHANSNFIHDSLKEQWDDVKSSVLTALFMGIIVFLIGTYLENPYFSLLVQFPVAIVIYIGISHFLNFESYIYVRESIRSQFRPYGGNRKEEVKN